MIKTVKNNDFSEVLKDSVAVVDFNATWCGPCKMLAPIFEELAQEMEGKVNFYSLDVDENMQLAAQYGIQAVPSMFLVKNGEVVDRAVGFQPKQELKAWIESH